jgi:hypothetical protein
LPQTFSKIAVHVPAVFFFSRPLAVDLPIVAWSDSTARPVTDFEEQLIFENEFV